MDEPTGLSGVNGVSSSARRRLTTVVTPSFFSSSKSEGRGCSPTLTCCESFLRIALEVRCFHLLCLGGHFAGGKGLISLCVAIDPFRKRYCAVQPPSMRISVPVMKPAASEHK